MWEWLLKKKTKSVEHTKYWAYELEFVQAVEFTDSDTRLVLEP